jgi:hypothetical protein
MLPANLSLTFMGARQKPVPHSIDRYWGCPLWPDKPCDQASPGAILPKSLGVKAMRATHLLLALPLMLILSAPSLAGEASTTASHVLKQCTTDTRISGS